MSLQAEANTGWFTAGSGPAVNTYCWARLTRNGTTITCDWYVEQNISSGSYLGQGSLEIGCGYAGTNQYRTMKDHSTTWSGGGGNNVSGSFTFTDTSATAKTFYIGFWSTSDYFSSSGIFETGVNITIDGSPSMTITKFQEKSGTRKKNSVTLEWATSIARDYTKYNINNGQWIDAGDIVASDNKSGYFTVNNLTPNTTYSFKVNIEQAGTSYWKQAGPISITTYPNTIPTISVSSKSVNSITVTSGCNVAVSSTQYRIKQGSGSYGSYQNSATFSNLAPNTSYTIEVKKVATNGGDIGYATVTASTYQIGTITTASNFNHGDNSSTVLANPSGASISLNMKIGSTSIFTDSVSAGTKTHTYTDTELDNIYKLYGMGNTLTATYTLTTTANSKTYTNTKTCTITLTGNQKTIREKINGTWKRGKNFVKINGTWKKSVVWQKVNGAWKRGI